MTKDTTLLGPLRNASVSVSNNDWQGRYYSGSISGISWSSFICRYTNHKFDCKVFSYLKRLGYIVTRATPPSIFYPKAQKFPLMHLPKPTPWISNLFRFVTRPFRSLFSTTLDWWKPLPLTGFFRRFTTYCKLNDPISQHINKY